MQTLYEVLKKSDLPKAILFTDNLTTLEVLKNFLLFNDFKVITTEQADYAKAFRVAKTAILLATDTAAKGLDFEFCPMVVNYDLLWNAIEMEQRIARCHRQGQREDVLVVNLLCRENMADVRILELINKRVLQFDGIFGMSDPLVGNFDTSLAEILPQLREKEEIAQAFSDNLQTHKPENKEQQPDFGLYSNALYHHYNRRAVSEYNEIYFVGQVLCAEFGSNPCGNPFPRSYRPKHGTTSI